MRISDWSSDVCSSDLRMQSGGEPLPRTVRASMEPAFGQDFGHVRIHRDAAAAGTADAIGARAYTLGNHIAFNRGTFAPGTAEGDHLIAHELAHVEEETGMVRRSVLHWLGDLFGSGDETGESTGEADAGPATEEVGPDRKSTRL